MSGHLAAQGLSITGKNAGNNLCVTCFMVQPVAKYKPLGVCPLGRVVCTRALAKLFPLLELSDLLLITG